MAHGAGRWDATECHAVRLKSVGGTVARWHPWGHSPHRSQWVPTGLVIAAVRNGELADQLARVGCKQKRRNRRSNVRDGMKEKIMRKVLRGYAKDKTGNLILIGAMPVPFSKDKCSPTARREKRYLVRHGATIFKKEIIR